MIDANIPLQGQNGSNILGQLAQLQNLQGQKQNIATGAIQQQSDQLKLDQQKQGAQDDADTRAAFAAGMKPHPNTGQPTFDRLAALSTLGKLNPTKAFQMQSQFEQQDQAASTAKTALAKAEADAQEAQVKAALAHVGGISSILNNVTDQASYTVALQHGTEVGLVKPGELSPIYDPAKVAQLQAQALTQQQVLENHAKQQGYQLEVRKQDETEDNNAALRDQAAGNAAELARHNKRDEGLQGGTLQLNRDKFKADQDQAAADASGIPAPTVADRNRASLAKIALANIDKMDEILKRRGDMIGPGSGRISNIDQLLGSNDPDLVALVNEAHNFSMSNAGVHGSRSVQNVRDAVHDLLGDLHNGPQGVQGGLDANRANLQAIISQGGGGNTAKGPATFKQTATGPNGHKIGSNDDGKTWMDVQTGKPVQ